jgi:hypothetical protein
MQPGSLRTTTNTSSASTGLACSLSDVHPTAFPRRGFHPCTFLQRSPSL